MITPTLDHDGAVVRREVRVFEAALTCAKCGRGELRRTATAPAIGVNPPQFEHRCDGCGDVRWLGDSWPKLQYERLPA